MSEPTISAERRQQLAAQAGRQSGVGEERITWTELRALLALASRAEEAEGLLREIRDAYPDVWKGAPQDAGDCDCLECRVARHLGDRP